MLRLRLCLWPTQTLKNAGYIKTIAADGRARQEVTRHGATSRLTLLWPSMRLNYPQEFLRPKGIQRTYTLHKQTRNFLLRWNRTTPWHEQISRPTHKLKGHWLRCSRRRFWSYQAMLRKSWWNLPQHKPRTPRMKKLGHQSTSDCQGLCTYSNLTSSYPNSSQDQNIYSRSGQRFDPNGYCSSHG